MRADQKIEVSQKLRQSLTGAEIILWLQLRNRKLNGRKFRRQHAIGPFVVDFCCVELNLIVELDGDVHAFQAAADASRQAYLEKHGYRDLRFTNVDVLNNLKGVLETLWSITDSV